MERLRVKIIRDWSWDREVMVLIKNAPNGDGRIVPHVARIEWDAKEDGFFLDPSQGTLSGGHGELANLFKNALRDAGDLDAEAVGKLKATERHLEDMRALIFKSGKP